MEKHLKKNIIKEPPDTLRDNAFGMRVKHTRERQNLSSNVLTIADIVDLVYMTF